MEGKVTTQRAFWEDSEEMCLGWAGYGEGTVVTGLKWAEENIIGDMKGMVL